MVGSPAARCNARTRDTSAPLDRGGGEVVIASSAHRMLPSPAVSPMPVQRQCLFQLLPAARGRCVLGCECLLGDAHHRQDVRVRVVVQRIGISLPSPRSRRSGAAPCTTGLLSGGRPANRRCRPISAKRAAQTGSRSYRWAAMASKRMRASFRYPVLLQNRQRANAIRAAAGPGRAVADSSAARRLSWSCSSRSSHVRCSTPGVRRRLRQLQHGVGVRGEDVDLASLGEHLRRVFADGVEHREALASSLSSRRTRLWSTSAPRPSNTSIPKFVRWTAYGFGHGEAAAAEDRQPVDAPLPVVEQVVAPRDSAAQCLLTFGHILEPAVSKAGDARARRGSGRGSSLMCAAASSTARGIP